MAKAAVGAVANRVGTNNLPSINRPAADPGDLLVAFVTTRSTGRYTGDKNGWTFVRTQNRGTANGNSALFTRRATSDDPASWSLAVDTGSVSNWMASCFAVKTIGIDAHNGTSSTNTGQAAHVAPAVPNTTTTPVVLRYASSITTTTPPQTWSWGSGATVVGYASNFDAGSPNISIAHSIAQEEPTGTPPVAARTGTASKPQAWMTMTVVFLDQPNVVDGATTDMTMGSDMAVSPTVALDGSFAASMEASMEAAPSVMFDGAAEMAFGTSFEVEPSIAASSSARFDSEFQLVGSPSVLASTAVLMEMEGTLDVQPSLLVTAPVRFDSEFTFDATPSVAVTTLSSFDAVFDVVTVDASVRKDGVAVARMGLSFVSTRLRAVQQSQAKLGSSLAAQSRLEGSPWSNC